MKANEAPKKIYLATTKEIQNLDTSFVGIAHSDPHDIVEPVEYIRTDVFIEKAVTWLMDNIQDYTDDGMGEHSFVLVQDLKEHFKNYMKGE